MEYHPFIISNYVKFACMTGPEHALIIAWIGFIDGSRKKAWIAGIKWTAGKGAKSFLDKSLEQYS